MWPVAWSAVCVALAVAEVVSVSEAGASVAAR